MLLFMLLSKKKGKSQPVSMCNLYIDLNETSFKSFFIIYNILHLTLMILKKNK